MERNEFFAALDVLAEEEPELIVKDDDQYNSPEFCELLDYGDYLSAYDSFGYISWKEDFEKVMDSVVEYVDAKHRWGEQGDEVAAEKFACLKREDLDYLADICDNMALYKIKYGESINTDGVVVTDELLNEARLKIKQDVSRVKILANRVLEGAEKGESLENAVKDDDIQKVEELLSHGVVVSNLFEEETLRFADSPEMIKCLVKNGAKIETDNGATSDLDEKYRSLFVATIREGRADKAAAYIQCGANVTYDATDVYGCDEESVQDALRSIRNSHKEAFGIISRMVEDVRNGKPCEEVRLEDYQNAGTPQREEPQTQNVAAETKQEERKGTPLPIIADDNGMVHLAPRENLRASAILPLTLYADDGAKMSITAAFVSDRFTLKANADIFQEDLTGSTDALKDSVFLIPYSQAKTVIAEMKSHGDTLNAQQAEIRGNLFRNMGEKSPVEKSYDDSAVRHFGRGGKGLGD